LARTTPNSREHYRHFLEIPTRWMDNDVYGHVNNVVYYSYFDTVVNKFLIDHGQLDYENGEIVGWVVETKCEYFAPVAFPDVVTAGLRVQKMGTSSVTYEVGLFRNDDEMAAAQGHFVHVYVELTTNKPTPLSDEMKAVLAGIG